MKGFLHVTHPANDVSTSEIPLSEWQVKQNLFWKICKCLKALFTSHFARTGGREKRCWVLLIVLTPQNCAVLGFHPPDGPFSLYLGFCRRNVSTDSTVKSTTWKKSVLMQSCRSRIPLHVKTCWNKRPVTKGHHLHQENNELLRLQLQFFFPNYKLKAKFKFIHHQNRSISALLACLQAFCLFVFHTFVSLCFWLSNQKVAPTPPQFWHKKNDSNLQKNGSGPPFPMGHRALCALPKDLWSMSRGVTEGVASGVQGLSGSPSHPPSQ